MNVRRRPLPAGLFLLFTFAAVGCQQGGSSDIGPRLAPLPSTSSRAVVLDTAGRGVVGARVDVVGTSMRLLTGRNGRGDFLAAPAGRLRFRVDGSDGAAVAGDRLASYVVAQTLVGVDLPSVLHVPDLPDSASATVVVGNQPGATTIVHPGGASLAIAASSSVGVDDGSTSTVVRCGEIPATQLPGDLPTPTSGALLWSRGVLVAPSGFTCAPGATLDIPDDLGLGSGSPLLYRLDPATGEWTAVTATTTASGGRLVATAAVTGAGIYAFAAPVAATAVTGKVIDGKDAVVPDVLVRVDQVHTTTAADGTFRADGVALTDASGFSRAARIELFAGGAWLPVRLAVDVGLQAGLTTTPDLRLDTLGAANVRVQQILRGNGDGLQTARIGSQDGAVALTTISDANGQGFFEDVPSGFFGYQTGRLRDVIDCNYGQAVAVIDRGRRWLDTSQFLARRAWFEGTRRTRATISDSVGGGPLEGGWLITGEIAEQGLVGVAGNGGSFFIDRNLAGRGTVVQFSRRENGSILHAFTFTRPDGEHLEFAMQRMQRAPIAAFDRHGLLAGLLTGVDTARLHELRTTRRLALEEWWDAVVDGIAIPSSLPIDIDPAVTHGAFVAGVASIGGSVAATELTSSGGRRPLQKVGVIEDLVPLEAQRQTQDIALAHVASTDFTLPGALAGADASIVATNLRLDLALQQPNGLVVDVVRDLADNITAVGSDDLRLTLPELAGDLAGRRWLALLRGSAVAGTDTLQHSSLVTLPGTAATFRLPAFPTVASPSPGSTVASTGFTVQFALPAGSLQGLLELRSTTGSDTLLWQVLLPPDATQFAFVKLPSTTPPAAPLLTPLQAGKTYTLTLTAFFAEGVFKDFPTAYRDLHPFQQSANVVERGVTRVARRSFTITTN